MGFGHKLRVIRDKITGASYSYGLRKRLNQCHRETTASLQNIIANVINSGIDNRAYMESAIEKLRLLDMKQTILATCDSAVYGKEMEYIRRHVGLGVFNYDFADDYADPKKHVEVFFDEEKGMHYVLHNGKRVYYPKKHGKEMVTVMYNGICLEQDERSPHRYIDPSIDEYKNGIVVEIGAAEASFSLDMVESAKEIYIFECGEEWLEPLNATFAPYNNVHIIRKFVSNKDEGEYCTLDTVLRDKAKDITVIKADVEGNEIDALGGATNIMKQAKHLMLLLCAYHRANDEADIRQMLGDKFKIEPRPGYMLFLPTGEAYGGELQYPFFRHGVLKCTKE